MFKELRTVASEAGDKSVVLARLRELLRTVRGKSKITLRTLRHQMRANLKQSGYHESDIAVIMGHAAEETNRVHYGRHRRAGWSQPVHINPDEQLFDKLRPGAGLKSMSQRALSPVDAIGMFGRPYAPSSRP